MQRLHIVTAANKLVDSFQLHNRSSLIYGGVPLRLHLDESAVDGWFLKVDTMRKIDSLVPPDDLVVFMDAFDTLVTIPAQEITRRFLALERKFDLTNAVVFNGCARWCFPFESWGFKTNVSMVLSDGSNVTGKGVYDYFR